MLQINKNKVICNYYSSGFLLIELLVALALLSFCAIVFGRYLDLCMRNRQRAQDRIEAINYARSYVEQVIAGGQATDLPVKGVQKRGRFKLTWQVHDYHLPILLPKKELFKRRLFQLGVKVMWQDVNKRTFSTAISTIITDRQLRGRI